MSVEISVTGNKLGPEAWTKILGAWEAKSEDPPFTDPVLGDPDPGGWQVAHLWRKGSTRGVVVAVNPNEKAVNVRLNVLSSRKDWISAFMVLRAALKHGGGAVEIEGDSVEASDLTAEEAVRRGTEDFVFSVGALSNQVGEGGSGSLPMPGFDLPIESDELSGIDDSNFTRFESELCDRIERYATAYQAATFRLNTGHRIGTWALIPTVTDRNADRIAVALSDVSEGGAETAELPTETLLEALGDRAELLGESIYLPELDPDAEPELIEKFRTLAAAVPPIEETEPKSGPADGGGEADAFDLRSPDGLAEVFAFVTVDMLGGKDPETVLNGLQARGLDPDSAAIFMQATAIALDGMGKGKPNPKKVIKAICKELEVPEDFAVIALGGVAQGLQSMYG